MKDIEYIKFEFSHFSSSKKTKIYNVSSVNGFRLGTIQWFSHWRKYVFYPYDQTIYDSQCLKIVSDYLIKINFEHKEKN